MKNKSFFSAMLVGLLAFGLTFSSCASSAAKQAIMSASSVDAVRGLNNKLLWLQSNAQSGGNYIIELSTDEKVEVGGDLFGICGILGCGYLSYENKNNITITLIGIGANRTIFGSGPGRIFDVGSGVTLVLDKNITIQGPSNVAVLQQAHTDALVSVSSGGTLIMNDGSITGGMNLNCILNHGGGVEVCGGTFIMKGGTITRNASFPVPNPGVIAASKGKYNAISGKNYCYGGGVYVDGTFTKTGGTITGYASDSENGNVIKDFAGNNVIQNHGHAVYFVGSGGKAIDTTVGPEVSFHFSNGKFSEAKNKKTKRKKIDDEPEEDFSSDDSGILEE